MKVGKWAWGLVALVAAGVAYSQREVTVYVEKSAFQTLVVADHAGRRCLQFGEGPRALNQTCRSLAHPERVELDYARAVTTTVLLWDPAPRRALIIGLGGGAIPTALAAERPELVVDAVELDPAVIRVATEYFGFTPSERVHAFAQDGLEFVRAARERHDQYDVVVLDAFDEQGIPPPLFTPAFLSDVRGLLAPGGAFVANTFVKSPHAREESETAQAIFGRALDVKVGSNRLIVASTGPLPEPSVLLARATTQRSSLERIGATESWLLSLHAHPLP